MYLIDFTVFYLKKEINIKTETMLYTWVAFRINHVCLLASASSYNRTNHDVKSSVKMQKRNCALKGRKLSPLWSINYALKYAVSAHHNTKMHLCTVTLRSNARCTGKTGALAQWNFSVLQNRQSLCAFLKAVKDNKLLCFSQNCLVYRNL